MLSLCLIVKNEEKTLPTLLKSIVGFVDEVVITDTGSTDKTKKVCEKLCGDKLKWSTFEWCDDFSAARDYNFSRAKGDWILWADADDEILNPENLADIIVQCEENNVNAVLFPYHYVVDEAGNTKCLQMRERLIQNNGTYKWIGKLHEAMLPVKQTARALKLSSVNWAHRTSEARVKESVIRNVYILEKAIEEEIAADNVDPRTLYNLGNAYFTIDEWAKALACYQKYIPMSGWDQEIYLAKHRSSLALFHLGEYNGAIEMALLAIKDQPIYPDAYVDLGKIYFQLEDFEKALYWLQEAEKKPYPESLPVVNPMDFGPNLDWLIGHCFVQLMKYKDAIPRFKSFKEKVPYSKEVDEILKELLKAYQEEQDVKAIAAAAKAIKSSDFWSLVPKKYLEYPEVAIERNKTVEVKEKTSGKDIAIYCGKCVLEFDPTSETDGGVGGSEEAVINLSRLLAKQGWNVTVFGRPKTEKDFDGVHYRHFTDYNPNEPFDVFISWRMPSLMSAQINAKKKFLWLHDCTPESSITPEALNNIDKIFVLSKAHRELYPNIEDERFFLTGNGINPEHFASEVDKNPNYCIYTSAPDRGLETLLKMWPKIKEKAPDAELHWFYGWETYDKLHAGKADKIAWKEKILKLLDQPGVFDEGRVDHETIAKKYQEAQLWLYPTEFYEIYCITADKAQAGGALPVTTTVGALDERVQYGVKLPVKDIYSNEKAQQDFIDRTVSYLLDPDVTDFEREGMAEWSLKNNSWQRISDQWDELFKK